MQMLSPVFAQDSGVAGPQGPTGETLAPGGLAQEGWACPVPPMFPLKTATLPANASDLASRLNESLRDLFNLTRDPVELREVAYPHLASLVVSLDDAQLSAKPPALPPLNRRPAPS